MGLLQGEGMGEEKRVVDAARVGDGPGDVPGVLLDGLEDTALVGTDGVFLADRHQRRHFAFSDVQFLAAPGGKCQVGHMVLVGG